MINRDDIINYIYKLRVVEKSATRFASVLGNYKDDFIQYIYLQILEIEESKLIELFSKGELVYYILAICRNNALGKYSAFFKEHRQKNIEELDEDKNSIQQSRFD